MTEQPESLDDYLESEFAGTPQLPTEDQDDLYAGKLMRRLVRIEKMITSNTGVADAERRAIASWETRVNQPLQEQAMFLRSQLEQYALHVRDTQGRKSVVLPHGVIETRRGLPQWVVDKEVFNQWAQDYNPHLLRIKYEPDMSAIKAALEEADGQAVEADLGTVVPGIVIHPATTGAIVKPNN